MRKLKRTTGINDFTKQEMIILIRVMQGHLDIEYVAQLLNIQVGYIQRKIRHMKKYKKAFIKKHSEIAKNEAKDITREEIEEHKCFKCHWGNWTGVKYKCVLPNCSKELGSFKNRKG